MLPAVVLGFLGSFPALWAIFTYGIIPSISMDLNFTPTFISICQAMLVGTVIPLVSSIIPLKVVLSQNLNDALDYSHSKQKAAYVKILRAQDFDKSPYLTFGSLSVVYGVSIYYLMPLALVSLNLGLLLNIFFMILMGLFFGLILLTSNF